MPALFVWRSRRPARALWSGLLRVRDRWGGTSPLAPSAVSCRLGCAGVVNVSTKGGLGETLRGARLVSDAAPTSSLRWRNAKGGELFCVRPGSIFHSRRLVVFVDGCFCHGCPRHGTQLKGNAAFWHAKFQRNRERDRRDTRNLRRAGWTVVRLWEHALRAKARTALLRKLHRLFA